jgi:predicted CoA-binding protein
MYRSSIEEASAFFLHAHRLAVVGVSRDPKDFSRFVFHEIARRGHDVVPVNPALVEADGVRAFARVADVDPPPDSALLLVPAEAAEAAVRDCLRARVHRIWLHRGAGAGVATEAALALCAANRVEVIHGLCPLMALPATSLPHRVHGLLRRVLVHPEHRGCGMHLH